MPSPESLTPDPEVMRAALDEPFAPFEGQGLIEIAFTGSDGGNINRARLFENTADGRAAAANFAAEVNASPGVNVYFAPSLRLASAARNKRAKKVDVLGSPIVWADFDAEGSHDAAREIYNRKGMAPHRAIVTGTKPKTRAQAFWRLDRLVTDQGELDEMLAGLHVGLEFVGDPKIVNADRLMRLAGGISWPKPGKEGREVELTTLHRPKQAPPAPYAVESFVETFPRRDPVRARKGEDAEPGADLLSTPPAPMAALPAPSVLSAPPTPPPAAPERTHDMLGRLVDGRDEHAMGILAGAIRNLAAKLGRWPTADELFADAWPTYERRCAPKNPGSTLEAEGRGPTWFREKCGTHARRAAAGAFVGLESIEKCVASAAAHAAPFGVLAVPVGPLFTPASELAGKPIAPRAWLVRDLVPHGTVTLLGGDGGTGKSLLALQLATSTATGGAWLHRPIERPGPALFLTAEDDLDEVHRRLGEICAAEGLELSALSRLMIRSLAGEDALLAVVDRARGTLVPTPLYGALDQAIGAARPAAVFLDTLADLHAGEENNRAHARQFIGLLRAIAIRHGCAIVLLAHPSLTGMSSGSGLSGSTAWNGSVRSRLYLDRVKDEGHEADPNARRLSTKKSNYGPTGEEIALRWESGIFKAEPPATGFDRMARTAKAERVFLKLLAEFNGEGRRVRHTTGDGFAPHAFAKSGRSEGLTKSELNAAMESLFARGVIVADTEGPPSRRVSFIRGAE